MPEKKRSPKRRLPEKKGPPEEKKPPEEASEVEEAGAVGKAARPFWSGTISFGLVSIPVSLYPATRTERVALRMLTPEGSPVRREYYCSAEQQPVESAAIVRGFEFSADEYVIASDEELEALAPEKSRDIDLRRFVPRTSLHPLSFDRAYFLVPASESTKAYRLLAATLERSERAGIATFVMRGKEYLVAILAAGGLLRSHTLRFADELRTPAEVGLPDVVTPSSALVKTMNRAIRERAKSQLAVSELHDEQLERTRALALSKQQQGEGVIEVASEQAASEGGAEVIDLMEALKRSLSRREDGPSLEEPSLEEGPSLEETSALEQQTRAELYRRAQAVDLPGRSQMDKAQLIEALERRGKRKAS